MSGRRIAVLGDIHGNIRALDAALATAVAAGYDELVLLGDLLTYGVDTVQVVDRVCGLCAQGGVTVLCGNHDAIYLEAGTGRLDAYVAGMPDWLRESVDLTLEMLPVERYATIPFVETKVTEGAYFSHANPFGKWDWRYLNSGDEHAQAIAELSRRGMSAGIFGHTHRAKICHMRAGVPSFVALPPEMRRMRLEEGPYVINAGSLGQPRSASKTCYVVVIELSPGGMSVGFRPIEYDVDAHLADLRNSGKLSPQTIDRLIGFHLDKAH